MSHGLFTTAVLTPCLFAEYDLDGCGAPLESLYISTEYQRRLSNCLDHLRCVVLDCFCVIYGFVIYKLYLKIWSAPRASQFDRNTVSKLGIGLLLHVIHVKATVVFSLILNLDDGK